MVCKKIKHKEDKENKFILFYLQTRFVCPSFFYGRKSAATRTCVLTAPPVGKTEYCRPHYVPIYCGFMYTHPLTVRV